MTPIASLTGIVTLLLMIGVVGFLVHLIVTYIAMPDVFKQVIIVACVILLVLFLLGVVAGGVHLPRIGLQ